jgi:hypothetical protein
MPGKAQATKNKKTVSGREAGLLAKMPLNLARLPCPYAGITQIRFLGFNLRPYCHPKSDSVTTLKNVTNSVKGMCGAVVALGVAFDGHPIPFALTAQAIPVYIISIDFGLNILIVDSDFLCARISPYLLVSLCGIIFFWLLGSFIQLRTSLSVFSRDIPTSGPRGRCFTHIPLSEKGDSHAI